MFAPVHFTHSIQGKRKNCASNTLSTVYTTRHIYFVWLKVFVRFSQFFMCHHFSLADMCAFKYQVYVDIRVWTRLMFAPSFGAQVKWCTKALSPFVSIDVYIFFVRLFLLNDIQKHLNIDNAREKDKNRAFRFISLHSFPFDLTWPSCIRNQ